MKIFTKTDAALFGNSFNKFYSILGLLALLLLGSVSYGQTNPTAYNLASGNWTLTGWNAGVATGSYPGNGATGSDTTTGVVATAGNGNMMFWKHGTTDPLIATAASANYASSYATGNNGTIYGNGTSGIGFNNTGGAGIGSAVLAINTTGRSNVQVAWTGRTIATGQRTYGIRLMYRLGTTGSFVDANGTAANILYPAAASAGSTTMPTITLPAAVNNAGTVQLLWYCYNEATTTSGTRPTLGLDDITVSSSSAITVNGTIAAGEYGTHTDGNNQQSSSTGTWYMTSDNTNLYIGVSGANVSEGAILYLDKNPIVPVNGGANSDGTLVGNTYDGSSFANLQFRADLVVYFRDGSQEYRTANGSNGWSSATTTGMTYASNAATSASGVREIAIPWSVIGGKPTSYNWFGYVAYSGGGAYASVPTENPGSSGGTVIGSSATWDRYYTVSTTGTTMPFSRNSYTFTRGTDVTSFGVITAYDFTMNSSGRFLSRSGNVTGNWTIAGNLTVGAGTIYQGSGGSSYGTTSIAGNLNLLGGAYNMDQTTGATTVAGNISIASGATLALSGTSGGDISVAGNWSNSGTFTPNTRAVTFTGASPQTMTGATTFDYLTMNGAGGLTLANNTTVNKTLTLTSGNITLGTNTLTIAASPATISGGSATSYIITNSTGALVRNSVTSTATSFPVGLATSYTPLTVTNTGTTNNLSLVVTSPPANAVSDATKIVNLEWNLNSAGTGAVGTIAFNWNTTNQGSSYSATGQGELGNYTAGPNYALTSLGTMSGQAKTVTGVALSSGNNKLVLGNTGAVYAVPPSNDNCSTATALVLDAAAVTGNVVNATQSLAATCAGTANDDVWYSFTTTGAGTYTITVVGSSSFDPVVDVRSGACNGTNIFCADNSASGGTETVTATGLAANTTYYVRVYDYTSGVPSTTTFTIAVVSPPASLSTNGTTALAFSTTQAPLTQSASQTFNLSGVSLTGAPGNITVTAPNTDFQVSNNNSTWGATALIAYSTGTLASTPVYVRFTPQSSGAKTGNITFSGGGTSSNPTIALTGTGVLPAPTANAATNIAATSFDANWTAVTGASSGYLLDVSTSATFGTTGAASVTESFESGMPASYTTGNATLGTGVWALTTASAIQSGTTGVNTGTVSAQLQSATNSALVSPAFTNVSTVSFYVTSSTSGGSVQVNYSTDGGTTWNAANESPFTGLGTTKTLKTATINATGNVILQFKRTAATIYFDDITINYQSSIPSFVTGYNAKPISGQATVTSSVTGLTADTTYYYRLRATDGTPSAYSNVITVNPASRGGSAAADQTICSGTQPAALTLSGNNGTVVKWQKATNTSFTGATDINVTATTLNGSDVGNLTATTYIRAVVQSFTNPTANSAYATITVTQSPTFANLQSPATGSICQTGTFDAYGQVYQAGITEAAGAGAGITAQFGYNTSNTDPSTWTNWDNATFNTQSGNNDEYKYTFTPPATGIYYYTFRYRQGTCAWEYGGYNGGFWNGTTNVNGTLTVSPTAVGGTASTSQTICSGTAPTALTLSGSTGSIQWQSSTDNSNFNNISGQTSATLTLGALSATTYYKAIVSSGSCASASSNVVTISVTQSPTYGNLQSPASGTICQTGTFTAYGQVYQSGVTEAAGAGSGITAQFGYSTSNTDPSTWTNWTNATFNTQVGNNDEYTYTFSPPASGTYYYTFRYRQGTCTWLYGGYNSGFWNGTSNVNGTLTVNATNTAGTASSTPTVCANTVLTNITHATTGATGIGTSTGLPAGVTASWASNTITISGTPTASGTFNYSIPLTGGCGSVNATGTITVNSTNTVGTASSTPTVCANTALTNITHITTGATGIGTSTGLPLGVTAAWASNTITISGTPTASGTFNYSIPLTGGCGSVNATGTITVNSTNTVGTASSTPTVCANTALTNITHATTGATGIGTSTGLPSGVTAAWVSNTITISGTPTTSGAFNYSIPLTGGCGSVNATGTITVNSTNTVGTASSTPTVCINTALTNITHTTTGATGIGTSTGLPVGVTASWSSNTITISGTPTASGTFNYSIPLTGGCGSVNATGTIIVNATNTVGTASSTPTVCANTVLTNITHATTGATGIGTSTGLPSGVTAAWASNTITISGTPTASGTFNYSIPLTGGCGSVNATGTITVRGASTAATITGSAAICSGSTTNLQVAITGGTAPFTVVYSGGTLNSYTSGTNIPVVPAATTSYTITSVTDANGCAGTGNGGTATVAIDVTTSTDGGLNWSNGTPSASKSVVYDGASATLSADMAACSLRLKNNATVTVNPGFDITLNGAVAVESGSTLTISNNSNLMQNGSNFTNTGNVTVKRNSSALKRLDYTLWSSPVTGQGLYAFSPFTLANRFYVYNPATNVYVGAGISATNLNSDGVNGTDSNNVQFDTGKGYLIRMPWDHPTTATVWNGSFTGVPHNGDIPVSISTAGEQTIGYGYNAVGNPYPSRINVQNFIDGNTNITGTLYFWRKTNDTTSNSYATLTKTAYVANGATGGDTGTGYFNSGDESNWAINIGQGFFVKATSGSTVNFTNSMRRSTNANQFFRNGQIVNTLNGGLYWLDLNTAAGTYSQMAVGYSSEGTLDFDRGIDGANINRDFYLTSLIGTDEYSIQGRPDFDVADVVPLSYKVTAAGNYTISIDHTNGLFDASAQSIYLKDNADNSTHDLRAGAYAFASEAGSFANRFEIVYQAQLGVQNPGFTANSVVIYRQGDNFAINSGNAIMKSIKVFDIRGRLLLEKNGINASQAIISGGLSDEVLLVQITSEEGSVVTKKVIR